MKTAILKLIRTYQRLFSFSFLKIVSGKYSCRFYPSCSNYTYQAIAKYGTIKGSFLGIRRLLRCQPFSKGGYDPVR